jgi:signal transduction histidine kinase/CheY-like chemotaxis protein
MVILRWFGDLRIRYKLFLIYSAVLLVTVGVGTLVLDSYVRQSIRHDVESDLTNSADLVIDMVKTAAAVSVKKDLRATAENNREIVRHYYQQSVSGRLSEEEAKAAVGAVLLSQRVGKTGYLFVWDIRNAPQSIPLAVHPKIQGQDVAGVDFVQEGARLKNGYLEYRWRNPGEDIELHWKPGADLWSVKMDPTQIDQILPNLCVNARDAIAWVGKVIISTGNVTFDEALCRAHPGGALPGEYVLLAVRDDGCGMDKRVLVKLFEPFFTTKEIGKGTDLGLSTFYCIVKQNNGFIDVSSEPGRGTTFRIYLPRTDVSISEEPRLQEQDKYLKGTETIVLVEDEGSILELSRRVVEHHGYLVLIANNPLDALDLAENHPGQIDLLITDVIMPGLNGKELMERLTTRKPGFRSIIMSGYTDDVIAQHGVLDEGVHFLQKPFSVKTLAEKVREVLEA